MESSVISKLNVNRHSCPWEKLTPPLDDKHTQGGGHWKGHYSTSRALTQLVRYCVLVLSMARTSQGPGFFYNVQVHLFQKVGLLFWTHMRLKVIITTVLFQSYTCWPFWSHSHRPIWPTVCTRQPKENAGDVSCIEEKAAAPEVSANVKISESRWTSRVQCQMSYSFKQDSSLHQQEK